MPLIVVQQQHRIYLNHRCAIWRREEFCCFGFRERPNGNQWQLVAKLRKTSVPNSVPNSKRRYPRHSTSVVCNNMRVFLFFAFFPREMKVSIRSLCILCKFTNQCSCPEFLAASCRCEIKVKLACSAVLGSRISSSFAELKGHELVAKVVTWY